MKNLFLFIFCLSFGFTQGQVTGVDYLMKYNCETNKYDVCIKILEGEATTIPQRAQFNSQISLVVPTGEVVQLTDLYMPLQNNQSYTGTTPIEWTLGTPVISPETQPENDFYGITPTLTPAAFYNDLQGNDIVTLFSFTVGSAGVYNENVRFFDNDNDPKKFELGMQGADFSNGFTLGGSAQLFNDYSVETCITDVQEELHSEPKVFPSPFQDILTIEVPYETQQITIIDNNGKVQSQMSKVSKGSLSINSSNYPSGIYFVRIKQNNGIVTTKKIVKI